MSEEGPNQGRAFACEPEELLQSPRTRVKLDMCSTSVTLALLRQQGTEQERLQKLAGQVAWPTLWGSRREPVSNKVEG